MITITEDKDAIEVHFEGSISDVAHEIWAILEGYRHNIGTELTLDFISGYLNHIADEWKEDNHD